jgi:hypothetical protein
MFFQSTSCSITNGKKLELVAIEQIPAKQLLYWTRLEWLTAHATCAEESVVT